MSFDAIQQTVLAHYNQGEHFVEMPDDVAACGDGLLRFLLVELSNAEDCLDYEHALARLQTAIHQLTELHDAIESKC
jgi:hypothetical protein